MPILISLVLLVILCGSSAAGFWLRRVLAERHFNRETLDSMRLVITMLVTFAALVLGLLTSSVKERFDTQTDVLRRYGANLIELDQRLREYGPDAASIRAMLRSYTAAAIADTWPDEARPAGQYPINLHSRGAEHVESIELGDMLARIDRTIQALTPSDVFRDRVAAALRARMLATLETRWTLIETARSTISWSFLILLMFWLMMVFAMFGLSAPRNRVMYATILCCGLSVASSLFLILDFDSPYDGLIALPSQPLRDALVHMDAPA